MSLRFLLDSNVLSEPVRPRPQPRVLEKIERLQPHLATASVVWHEMLFGAASVVDPRKRDLLERYLAEAVAASLPILPYDHEAASWHARERARLVAAGLTPSFIDGQIAAIAHVNGLVLVTRNTAHFAPFRGLRVESWFAAR